MKEQIEFNDNLKDYFQKEGKVAIRKHNIQKLFKMKNMVLSIKKSYGDNNNSINQMFKGWKKQNNQGAGYMEAGTTARAGV